MKNFPYLSKLSKEQQKLALHTARGVWNSDISGPTLYAACELILESDEFQGEHDSGLYNVKFNESKQPSLILPSSYMFPTNT